MRLNMSYTSAIYFSLENIPWDKVDLNYEVIKKCTLFRPNVSHLQM